ncbi:glycoside hydrolase family 2 [Streptomyces hirsutus]
MYDPTDAADGENPPLGKQRPYPSGIWYTPSSGIWQTVWDEPVARDHVDSLKLVPDVPANGSPWRRRASGTACPSRGPRRTTDGARSPPRPAAPGNRWTCGSRTRGCVSPPDDPFLYRLEVTVGTDRVGSYFGMRSIAVEEIDGVPRTVLNGEPVFLMATLDQGFWPYWLSHTAPTDEALAYDLRVHKQSGFNSVRKHIKVEPDRWFYWADRLGLMVWQDMPSMRAGVNPDASPRPLRARDEADDRRARQQPVHRHVGHLQRGLGPVRRRPHRRTGQGLGPVAPGQQPVGAQSRCRRQRRRHHGRDRAIPAPRLHRSPDGRGGAPWSPASTAGPAVAARPVTPGRSSSCTSTSIRRTPRTTSPSSTRYGPWSAGAATAPCTRIYVEGELNGLLTHRRARRAGRRPGEGRP